MLVVALILPLTDEHDSTLPEITSQVLRMKEHSTSCILPFSQYLGCWVDVNNKCGAEVGR